MFEVCACFEPWTFTVPFRLLTDELQAPTVLEGYVTNDFDDGGSFSFSQYHNYSMV